MIIEKKKLSELKAAPYNPRTSTEKQEANLKSSLDKFGFVEPIIFNKQTGYIVGGHFRVRELKKLGYKEVECVIVDLNEADEKEFNIRLNANTGSWDWEQLANEWNSEDLEAWGLDIPNYAAGIPENDMTDDDVDIDQEFDPIGKASGLFNIVIVFDGKEEAESWLNINSLEFVKFAQSWKVNLSTQFTLSAKGGLTAL